MAATLEMTTGTAPKPSLTKPRSKIPSLVVATDGSDSSIPAFRAAQLIMAASEAQVHVISVLERLPVVMPLPDMMLLTTDDDTSRVEAQRALVREQLAKFDPDGEWSMGMEFGRPGEAIASIARERNADLIIMGMNKHGLWDRFFGEETAMEIARLTEVPLLIATPEMKRLPLRVIVAMDLNTGGLRGLPEILTLLDNHPSLSCVHVKPRAEFLGVDWADLDREYELAVEERFGDMEQRLQLNGMRPDLIVLHGDVSRELIGYALYSKVELLVVGINRRLGRSRAIGGRMAAKMVRRSECSLLIVPTTLAGEVVPTAGADTETVYHTTMWEPTLKRFTTRNAGRRVVLEIDDPEIGALVEVASYPLLGVDYDHRDGRIDIMLGDFRGGQRHLTRSIPKPDSLSVLSIGGTDIALSVAHDSGQTLLTFRG